MAASKTPTIDQLPETTRKKVVDALLAGESLRKVAKIAGVSHVQVGAYKRKVLLPAIQTAQKIQHFQSPTATPAQIAAETTSLTRDIVKASPLMERHQFLWDKTVQGIERAENSIRVVRDRKTGELIPVGEDVTAIAPLLNQAHKNLEILGQVTGETGQHSASGNAGVNITINCPGDPSRPKVRADDDGVTIDIG